MSVFKAFLVATALTLPLSAPAWAEAPATISITGEGSVEGTPDMAVISLGVTTEGQTAAEAMAANTAALKTVLDRLKATGLEDRDVQTSNLSLNPNWTGYDGSSTPKIAGYTASNQLMIRIRDLAQLGTVLDAAITDGANTLNGLTFSLSDPKPAMNEARLEAVADARAKAELLVTAAGGKLGRLISISEGGASLPPMPMFRQAAADSAAVPVEAGEIATTASVTIVFEIMQ